MSHNMSLYLDLSDRLLAVEREIHYLSTQLADTKDTLRARQRMQPGQGNDFYSSDQDTWTAMSSGVGTGKEPPLDSLLPSGSRTH
jgi:hypothetical protein